MLIKNIKKDFNQADTHSSRPNITAKHISALFSLFHHQIHCFLTDKGPSLNVFLSTEQLFFEVSIHLSSSLCS